MKTMSEKPEQMPDNVTDRPLVTFVVLAYNQEEYIREAVDGAFAQTYSPLEIILSDDCSTDRTFEIMQEMAEKYQGNHEVRVRRNSSNLGLAGHINEAHKGASGQFITWSAGDDIALFDRTTIFVYALLSEGLNMVHSALLKIDLEGKELNVNQHPSNVRQPSMQSVVLQIRGVVTQSFCFRKSAFDIFGELSRDVTHEAIVYGFRAASLGKIRYISEPLTKYRIGSGISTSNVRNTPLHRQNEAIKVSGWRMTALNQIRRDLEISTKFKPEYGLEDLINTELAKWELIHSINKGNLPAVFEAIRTRYIFNKDVLRAVIRTCKYQATKIIFSRSMKNER